MNFFTRTSTRRLIDAFCVAAIGLLTLLAVSTEAQGQTLSGSNRSFTATGRTIQFGLPETFCLLGNSDFEQALMGRARQAVSPQLKIHVYAAPCDELTEAVAGRRQWFTNWLMIQQLSAKGNFDALNMSRAEFIAGIAKAKPTFSNPDLLARTEEAISRLGASMSNSSFEIVGTDGKAVYAALSMRIQYEGTGTARQIRGFQAITLVNGIPLQVLSYVSTNDKVSQDRARRAMESSLQALLAKN